MLAALLAAALAFTAEDASLAYSTAARLFAEHTPRDAGTRRAHLAADFLMDAASAAGADVRRDAFSAKTPKGERSFVNLYAEFQVDPAAPWTIVLSHYDTKPGVKCPGANDGASTSGLLVALAGRLASCDIAVNPIVRRSAGSLINKVADYAAAGLPVLNSQECEEYRELVDRYRCGLNCRCENAPDMAEKLKTLIDDPQLRKTMGANSRRLAADVFDRRVEYPRIIELFRSFRREA